MISGVAFADLRDVFAGVTDVAGNLRLTRAAGYLGGNSGMQTSAGALHSGLGLRERSHGCLQLGGHVASVAGTPDGNKLRELGLTRRVYLR